MKRQKNYRQLRSKSSARNRLSEIKSRTVVPDTSQSDATAYAENNNLFDENTEKAAYGELPEDRFDNTPLPDFQFDWDEEFFGTASTGNNGLTESIPFELQPVEEVQAATEAEVKQEAGSGIQEEITAVNIPEPAEPTPTATVETEPVQKNTVTVTAAPARFVSVKRQMTAEKREVEKMRKPEATKPAGKPGVINNTVVKKTDSPAGKKGRVAYGLPAKYSQNTSSAAVRTETVSQKPATGISGVEKMSEAPSLNVRHAPSFRSFVVSTIQRLMEQQRFLASEPESSRFLARELGIGKKEETESSDTSAQETGQVGNTRWNNPLIAAASTGLGQGAKGQKSNSALPGEKQPATRSSSARGKSKPAPGSYELNAARITLMEARINAKAISGNMRMKW
jgi:hypothetical protein